MDKKEKCKEIMAKLFGPASAEQVDDMEGDIVAQCRAKVAMLLGEEAAKQFDTL